MSFSLAILTGNIVKIIKGEYRVAIIIAICMCISLSSYNEITRYKDFMNEDTASEEVQEEVGEKEAEGSKNEEVSEEK